MPFNHYSIMLYALAILVFIVGGVVLVGAVVRARLQARARARQRVADDDGAPAMVPAPAASSSVLTPLPYAAIPTLLTDAEQQFFATLRAAVPHGLMICPQVRLANLVRPTARNQRQHTYDFYRIQAKCVDFVLCDAATTAPRLVIELDDASHSRADRRARDAFVDAVLAQVGLPMLHVPWQRGYDPAQLASAIRAKLPPPASAPPFGLAPPSAGALPAAMPRPRVVAAPPIASHIRYACGQCQREVAKDTKYCTHCGVALSVM